MDLNLTNAVAATSGDIWWWVLGIAAVVGLIWWWSAASGNTRRMTAGGAEGGDGGDAAHAAPEANAGQDGEGAPAGENTGEGQQQG